MEHIDLEQWKVQIENWTNQFHQLDQFVEYVHQVPPPQIYAAVAVLLGCSNATSPTPLCWRVSAGVERVFSFISYAMDLTILAQSCQWNQMKGPLFYILKSQRQGRRGPYIL